jgi:hypothetical protein
LAIEQQYRKLVENRPMQRKGGTAMPEPIAKAALLDTIQTGYSQFETLLAPLSEEQMTTPTVNGTWSIKDTIAHLTAWQGYLLNQLQGVICRQGAAGVHAWPLH